MPGGHIPERRQPIDVLLAADVRQHGAFAPLEDNRVLMIRQMKLRMDDMGLVEGLEFVDLVVVQMITSILLRRVIIRMGAAAATPEPPPARPRAHAASRSRSMAP